MSAELDLQRSYQEWRRLTEAVGEAIRSGNWALVSDCQHALRQIQPRLAPQTAAARGEWAAQGLNPAAKQKELNSVIQSLIELERRNHALIDARRFFARAELAKLEQAGLILRRIQRSYVPAESAGWSSYS